MPSKHPVIQEMENQQATQKAFQQQTTPSPVQIVYTGVHFMLYGLIFGGLITVFFANAVYTVKLRHVKRKLGVI